MTLVLVATPGAVNANAYCDTTAAQTIIDATPNATAWGDDDDQHTQWLIYATTLLEALAYKGVKASVNQSLAWPRMSVIDPDYGEAENVGYKMGGDWGVYLDYTTIPRRMVRACVMLALEIARAGTSDVWGVDKTTNVQTKTVGELSTTWFNPSERKNGLRLYPSVWREVYPLTLASVSSEVSRA